MTAVKAAGYTSAGSRGQFHVIPSPNIMLMFIALWYWNIGTGRRLRQWEAK